MAFSTVYSFLKTKVYTYLKHFGFKSFGRNSYIRPFCELLVGKQFIEIGHDTIIGSHIQLTAWSTNTQKSNPTIQIGSYSQIGSYNHITAANCIVVGEGVLTGKFVTITDNSHGLSNELDIELSPIKRSIHSKGPVIIEDNVWIGDKASILPNVRIGRGSVVGANSVVTKDVPAFTIVAGNPARIIRKIK